MSVSIFGREDVKRGCEEIFAIQNQVEYVGYENTMNI